MRALLIITKKFMVSLDPVKGTEFVKSFETLPEKVQTVDMEFLKKFSSLQTVDNDKGFSETYKKKAMDILYSTLGQKVLLLNDGTRRDTPYLPYLIKIVDNLNDGFNLKEAVKNSEHMAVIIEKKLKDEGLA